MADELKSTHMIVYPPSCFGKEKQDFRGANDFRTYAGTMLISDLSYEDFSQPEWCIECSIIDYVHFSPPICQDSLPHILLKPRISF